MDGRLWRTALSKYLIVWAFVLLVTGGVLFFAHQTIQSYEEYIVSDTDQLTELMPNENRSAVVFGSAVDYIAGEPRPIVQARLDKAYELYENDFITTIIVSGHKDTVAMDYDEPAVMSSYLEYLGVSSQDILLDNHGDSSVLTCQQAKRQFGLDTAVLVTQASHMSRALYLCRSMGIEAYGVTSDAVSTDQGEALQNIREAFGNVKAVLDVTLRYNENHE